MHMAVPMGLSLSSSAFDGTDPGLPLVPSLQPPPKLFSSLNLLNQPLVCPRTQDQLTLVFELSSYSFPGSSMVENLPTMWETWVRFLGQEDPLEKGMATHSSILAWRIPRTKESGGL